MQLTAKKINSQIGAVLITMVFLIGILTIAFLLQRYSAVDISLARDKKTSLSLSQAKQALLAFSAEPVSDAPKVTLGTSMTCDLNCPRPGDLPCPDTDNNGEAESTCTTQSSRLGRFPWKTLGTDDLRDGSGERLWYAVSNQYKNSPRILPLNSESNGSISLRKVQGDLVFDATLASGLAAVVIAPNEVLIRSDNIVQARGAGQYNIASNYLDIANGEDNANFADGTTDGFLSGEVKQSGKKILNDVVLPITRDEMNAMIEPRVLGEVMQAIMYRFCQDRANYKNRTCNISTANDFLPDPALVTDISCLATNTNIANNVCMSNSSTFFGRLAVGGNTDISNAGGGWESQDANSILRGVREHNWFQQNNWRELIFYAVAPACKEATKGCTGTGFITLNNALVSPINNKKVVLISAGRPLAGQSRLTISDKNNLSNYLEDENLMPIDFIFSRNIQDNNKNDRVTSIR